jgi:hypothetical protein
MFGGFMKRAKRGFDSARIVLFGAMAIAAAGLSGCGDSGTSSASNAQGTTSTATSTAQGAPTIEGNAITTATVGTAYSFQPQVTSASTAAITFTIANKPAWATFNASTGQLSGTPATKDVGPYAGVEISATDGKSVIPLPAFTITVAAASAGSSSVSLGWVAPTENSDGSTLQDLKGYKIHYGTQSQTYTSEIPVANPTLTTYLVSNLPAGTYFFAVTAYNSSGVESSLSDEISATFN